MRSVTPWDHVKGLSCFVLLVILYFACVYLLAFPPFWK